MTHINPIISLKLSPHIPFVAGFCQFAAAAEPPAEPMSVWFTAPARSYHESCPHGNGRLGAMDLGGVDSCQIVLNESSVWSGGAYDANRPDAYKFLELTYNNPMKLQTITQTPAAALLLMTSLVQAETKTETKAEFDQRMEWFREARFGMFIHWGLYSVPAGEWKGQKFDSNVEWIQSHAQIPVAEYTPLKDRFNPSKYDPEAWVKLAKDAGMKYIVITTKHHDGFCLWDSKQTDWDIASKGGNYLLNVGPTAEGEIPAVSIERLQAIASWMKENSDAIHGTQASPFPRIPAWGRCTTRPLPGGKTRLYLHVFDWPSDGRLVLTGLANKALGASLLTKPGQALVVENDAKGTVIQLPGQAPDALASVIVLDVTGTPVSDPIGTREVSLPLHLG